MLDQYLSDSYRLVILRQATIGTAMEIHNSLSKAEVLSPNNKATR